MQVITIGLNIARHVFQVHCIDADGMACGSQEATAIWSDRVFRGVGNRAESGWACAPVTYGSTTYSQAHLHQSKPGAFHMKSLITTAALQLGSLRAVNCISWGST
jgi:hypothetical protein